MEITKTQAVLAGMGLVYNLAIVALATFLIVQYDWSPWTYVGFMFFMVNTSTKSS